MNAPRQTLKARYIFPVSGPPIADGVITIAGERIEAVGEKRSSKALADLGNVAILPGLVNAHTHLEFSDLAEPLGSPGSSLPDWIGKVVAHRREAGEAGNLSRFRGLAETFRGGATSLGEIATSPWLDFPPGSESRRSIDWSPADVTVFWEVIGLRPEQFGERLAAAWAHLDCAWPDGRYARPGLSPHAPYSVHPELLGRVVRLAKAANVPVAMHLAESREELELLAHSSGPFRQLLENLGVWSAEVFPGGRTPMDYLRALVDSPRALAIHGNYLDREEIDFLAEHQATMSVVYCPRTHAYFRHERYPLAEMLECGVNVALGTDSRASNPNLSLLDELRFAAHTNPEISPAKILEMATLGGARALGIADEAGSLEPGKLADLIAVDLPEGEAADPHELLLAGELPVRAAMKCGAGVPFANLR